MRSRDEPYSDDGDIEDARRIRILIGRRGEVQDQESVRVDVRSRLLRRNRAAYGICRGTKRHHETVAQPLKLTPAMDGDSVGEQPVMWLEELLRRFIAHTMQEGGRVDEVREEDRGDPGTCAFAHSSVPEQRMEEMGPGGDPARSITVPPLISAGVLPKISSLTKDNAPTKPGRVKANGRLPVRTAARPTGLVPPTTPRCPASGSHLRLQARLGVVPPRTATAARLPSRRRRWLGLWIARD